MRSLLRQRPRTLRIVAAALVLLVGFIVASDFAADHGPRAEGQNCGTDIFRPWKDLDFYNAQGRDCLWHAYLQVKRATLHVAMFGIDSGYTAAISVRQGGVDVVARDFGYGAAHATPVRDVCSSLVRSAYGNEKATPAPGGHYGFTLRGCSGEFDSDYPPTDPCAPGLADPSSC